MRGWAPDSCDTARRTDRSSRRLRRSYRPHRRDGRRNDGTSAALFSVKSATILSATWDCVAGPLVLPVSPTVWKTIWPAFWIAAMRAGPCEPSTSASCSTGSAAPPRGAGKGSNCADLFQLLICNRIAEAGRVRGGRWLGEHRIVRCFWFGRFFLCGRLTWLRWCCGRCCLAMGEGSS